MSDISRAQDRVLAVDPFTRGFGFAVMEGQKALLDWGIKGVRQDKNAKCLKRIAELVERYQLDAIIVEDYQGMGSRRSLRVRRLISDIRNLAAERSIVCYSFSREEVRKTFSQFGDATKHEIAIIIADHLPQLAPQPPPPRKYWEIEDQRMNIFDAMSFAFTFYHFENPRKRAA